MVVELEKSHMGICQGSVALNAERHSSKLAVGYITDLA